MQNFRKLALGLYVAAGLVACGGGGGGSSTAAASFAALDSSSQTVASQDVASTALGLFSNAQVALGAVNSNEYSLYKTAFAQLDLLPEYVSDARANPVATGAVATRSYDCSYGGTFGVAVTDADNSSSASAGDSLTITFFNCNQGQGPVSGGLSFRIDTLNGVYGAIPSKVSVTMEFGNLGVSTAAYSGSINGAITVSGAKTGLIVQTQSITTSALSVTATYGGVTRSRALTSFNATESRTSDESATYLSRYTLNGTLTSSGFGGTKAVSFQTPILLVRRAADAYPYTGTLEISGANKSTLRMTADSSSLVRLNLDADGDGIYEGTKTVTWTSLL